MAPLGTGGRPGGLGEGAPTLKIAHLLASFWQTTLPLCASAAVLGIPYLRPSAYFWTQVACLASVARSPGLRGLSHLDMQGCCCGR